MKIEQSENHVDIGVGLYSTGGELWGRVQAWAKSDDENDVEWVFEIGRHHSTFSQLPSEMETFNTKEEAVTACITSLKKKVNELREEMNDIDEELNKAVSQFELVAV